MAPAIERSWGGVKLSLGALTIGAVIAGCGGSTTLSRPIAPARPSAAAASCAGVSPGQQFASARLVFLGRMLPGPSTSMAGRDVLGSPVSVRVLRYLKGTGPRTVRVATAVTIKSTGLTVLEDGIEPQVGEIWKLYTQSRHQPFATSICGGSTRIRSAVEVALALWNGFPVQARPRPIIPLGEGVVLDPRTGFPDDATKLAYSEGRFVLRAPLPKGPATAGRLRISSAADAFGRLRATERSGATNVPALVVRAVHLRTATFLTDRGRKRLPAWQFSFKRVAKPASVLALAPPNVFILLRYNSSVRPGPETRSKTPLEPTAREQRSRSPSSAPRPAMDHATRAIPRAPSQTAARSRSPSRRSHRPPRRAQCVPPWATYVRRRCASQGRSAAECSSQAAMGARSQSPDER